MAKNLVLITLCALMLLVMPSCHIPMSTIYTTGPSALSETAIAQTINIFRDNRPTTLSEMQALMGEAPGTTGSDEKGDYYQWNYAAINTQQGTLIHAAWLACKCRNGRIELACLRTHDSNQKVTMYGDRELYNWEKHTALKNTIDGRVARAQEQHQLALKRQAELQVQQQAIISTALTTGITQALSTGFRKPTTTTTPLPSTTPASVPAPVKTKVPVNVGPGLNEAWYEREKSRIKSGYYGFKTS